MDICFILVVLSFITAILFLFILSLSDCDLTLKFYKKFGTPIEKLAGKVVWIIGASGGIGEGLAKELAHANCKLILTARRKDELKRVKTQCHEIGAENVVILPFDITSISEHVSYVNQAFNFFGTLDIMVCNAGRSQRALWENVDIQVDRDVFEVNVFGVISLSTLVVRRFLKSSKGGHIAITTSTVGKFGFPGSKSYTGSKHALHGYFESLRIEHHCSNIQVTMLCPGPTATELLKSAFTDKPGKALGENKPIDDKRMPVERCSQLCAAAIANKLDEVWIAQQPILSWYYMFQYMPSISRKIFALMGARLMIKFRDNQNMNKAE